MKKLLLLSALFLVGFNTHAQLRFGPLVGVNISSASASAMSGTATVESKTRGVFGVITSYNLTERFQIESGLLASFKGYSVKVDNPNRIYKPIDKEDRLLMYAAIPINM